MTARPIVVIALVAAAAIGAGCRVGKGVRPTYGAEQEHALLVATVAADVTTVRTLLTAGANPNSVVKFVELGDEQYQSAWAKALRGSWKSGHAAESREIITLLLAAGADPNRAWFTTGTAGGPRAPVLTNDEPLMLLGSTEPEPVAALFEAGARPTAEHAEVVLDNAILAGKLETVKVLVEHGVEVNYSYSGVTPLVEAVQARNEAIMTYLEQHGAREQARSGRPSVFSQLARLFS